MRIAVVAGPAAGHIFPAAALAQGLLRRGHDVLVLTGELWPAPVARGGVPAQCLPILRHDGRDDTFGFRIYGRGAQSAPGTAELIEAFGAEAVVVDTLTVGGAYAAGLLSLPWIELIPHPLQDVCADVSSPGTSLAPGRGPLGRGARQHAAQAAPAGHRQDDARAVGCAPVIGLPDEGPPVGRLVATLPGLEIARADWPARTAVVGPLEWDPADCAAVAATR